ncbi:MAG: IS5/IS1182 family transposase, partial [Marinifilum sp.]|nr:IS5/IS1182 family transposase [Marinifilum sp.]
MIKYTPENQLSLELFEHPFETELDRKNRWVVLAKLVPWDDLANIYCSKLNATSG